MSVGCFVGPIRSSYIDQAQDAAATFVGSIDSALRLNGLPGYVDPASSPDVYSRRGLFGRSELDHHGASCFVTLAGIAKKHFGAQHIGLLAANPYRVSYLPISFDEPIPTGYVEQIAGQPVEIWVGSNPMLFRELTDLAPALGIPLTAGELTDDIASRINDFAALYDGDDRSFANDERTAWLVLYEGARLAHLHGVALSLAG
jgi:hypothetical protein